MKSNMRKKAKKSDVFIIIMTASMILLLILWVIKDNFISAGDNQNNTVEQNTIESFNEINLSEALKIINDDNLSFIYIGYEGCNACDEFAPRLYQASKKYDMEVYYLDFKMINKESQEWKTFTNLLSKKVTLTIKDKDSDETVAYTKTIGKFLYENGYTPTFVVLKSNKIVDGNIGSTSVEKLYSFLDGAGFKKKS